MASHTYGVVGSNSGYVDTSSTLKGAKQYATRNGYTSVYCRPNNGYHVYPVARRINGKWINL